jgi:hypothetical protein
MAQQPPHVRGVIVGTELAADELGDPRDGPQLAGEPVRCSAFQQQLGEPLEVRVAQASRACPSTPGWRPRQASSALAGQRAVSVWPIPGNGCPPARCRLGVALGFS